MIDIFSITILCPLVNIPVLQRSNSYVYFIINTVIGYHVLFLALNIKGRKVTCLYSVFSNVFLFAFELAKGTF